MQLRFDTKGLTCFLHVTETQTRRLVVHVYTVAMLNYCRMPSLGKGGRTRGRMKRREGRAKRETVRYGKKKDRRFIQCLLPLFLFREYPPWRGTVFLCNNLWIQFTLHQFHCKGMRKGEEKGGGERAGYSFQIFVYTTSLCSQEIHGWLFPSSVFCKDFIWNWVKCWFKMSSFLGGPSP